MASSNKNDSKAATLARIQRTEVYAEGVRRAFAKTVNAILALNKTMPKLDEGEMYSFDAQKESMQKKVEALLRQLHSVVTTAIKRGIVLEWDKANDECDKLVQSCFGKDVLSSSTFTAWTNRNETAQQSFINRAEKGLNLSQRIWQNVQQLRDEMEVAMTVAIGEGNSAASMSRKVRQYLNDPDLMFRRFRYKDENGEWQRKWKKRVKDEATGKYKWIDYDKDSYKVGAGVYKSSAKNAMRVTRTETNIAYRRADHERWSQMDFVIGQRVNLSRSHPKKDICDKLAGDYPKDFVFDGWHPQCFCYVTPITLPPEETAHLTKMMLNGEDWRAELKRLVRGREIKSYPDNFKQWVSENADNIAASRERGTEPYFIRNNGAAIDNILNPKKQLTPLEIADKRHAERDEKKVAEIREAWNDRQVNRLHDFIRNGYLPAECADTIKLIKDSNALGDYDDAQQRIKVLMQAAQRHAQRTPYEVEAIKQNWNARNARLQALAEEAKKAAAQAASIPLQTPTTSLEKVTVSDMNYVADSPKKMTTDERVHAIAQNVINYLGENDPNGQLMKYYTQRSGFSDGNVGDARKLARQILGTAGEPELPVINHLMELRDSAKLGQIYEPWRARYNEIIKKLNVHNFVQDGYRPVVNEIEEAYNIYRLSVSKEALKYGITRLSAKTPFVLFDEFEKKIPGFVNSIPQKDFFDAFPEYVPLFIKKPTGAGADSYSSGARNHVVICLSSKNNILRLTTSPWYRDGLLYHEYGHAYDKLTGQRSDPALKKIFDDFKHKVRTDAKAVSEMQKFVTDTLTPKKDAFNDWWPTSERYKELQRMCAAAVDWKTKKKIIDEISEARKEEYAKQLYDIEEQLGAFTDFLQAAMPGHKFISPRGHDDTYFSREDAQLAEFIAHCSESYWSGNQYIEKIAPDLYRQMREYIESKLPDAIRKRRKK